MVWPNKITLKSVHCTKISKRAQKVHDKPIRIQNNNWLGKYFKSTSEISLKPNFTHFKKLIA
jgi:hypothetical protein